MSWIMEIYLPSNGDSYHQNLMPLFYLLNNTSKALKYSLKSMLACFHNKVRMKNNHFIELNRSDLSFQHKHVL